MSLDDEMQEQPRPEPGFRVYVERESTKIDMTHAVMDVYDIAINSDPPSALSGSITSTISACDVGMTTTATIPSAKQRKHCAITTCPCAGFVRPAEAEELAK